MTRMLETRIRSSPKTPSGAMTPGPASRTAASITRSRLQLTLQSKRRDSIDRGQVLFDQKPFNIIVPGLNDEQHLPSITGACGTCHDSPNVGNHSVGAFFKIGLDDADSSLDIGYLPVITLRNRHTHEATVTTDRDRPTLRGK